MNKSWFNLEEIESFRDNLPSIYEELFLNKEVADMKEDKQGDAEIILEQIKDTLLPPHDSSDALRGLVIYTPESSQEKL